MMSGTTSRSSKIQEKMNDMFLYLSRCVSKKKRSTSHGDISNKNISLRQASQEEPQTPASPSKRRQPPKLWITEFERNSRLARVNLDSQVSKEDHGDSQRSETGILLTGNMEVKIDEVEM